MSEPLHTRPAVRQFGRFVVIGFLNTGLDWIVFFALTSWVAWFSQHILVANALAFCVGFSNSFVFNRRWTFRSGDPRVTRQLVIFLLINLAGLGISQTILATAYAVTTSRLLSKTAAVGVTMFWNFFASRRLAFRS